MTENLTLNVASMDETHDDFLHLLDAAKAAKGSGFLERFSALIEHTESHFEMEAELMRSHGFYGLQEHLDEHDNLLGEMRFFFEKAKKMPAFGLAYINDYAYDKFKRHIINIDSQLAMFLKSQTEVSYA